MKAIFKHIIHQELELRLLEPRSADEVFAVIEQNREHLSKWFPWVDRTESVEDTKAFIVHELKRFGDNNGFSAGIFYKGKYAGSVSLHEINWKNKLTSIGYWLSSEIQGKGIITTCTREILDYGFKTLGLNKIEIRARTDNARSIAIPVRLGFTKEGVLRQVDFHNDQYYDHVVYGMLKNEWEAHA